MGLKLLVVKALNAACMGVDEVACRPAVAKLTLPLPRWWTCQFAELAWRLDARWSTGYFDGWGPNGTCEICRRRAAWLVSGGAIDDDGTATGEPDYCYEPDEYDTFGFMALHPVRSCYWCNLGDHYPIEDAEQLEAAIAAERRRSISWRWRYRR